jgi:ubiquitin-protein ligase
VTTPQEIRRARLVSDFVEMSNIRGPMIDWRAERGKAPHVEKYHLTVHVRTVIDPVPTYRDVHDMTVTIPPEYPRKPPQITMLTKPVAYHPNWFVNGNWCYGTWDLTEHLGSHVLRMIRTLQYDLMITNEKSPANLAARDWYVRNNKRGLFPTDRQHLPDPTKKRMEIVTPPKTFTIG